MAEFPSGAWDLERPNLVGWTGDLASAMIPSAGVNSARKSLFRLGERLDTLLQVDAMEDELEDEDDQPPVDLSMPPPPMPPKAFQAMRRSATNDKLVVNDPSVCVPVSLVIAGH